MVEKNHANVCQVIRSNLDGSRDDEVGDDEEERGAVRDVELSDGHFHKTTP